MGRKTPGLRRHGAGWQAYITVHGELHTQTFDLHTPVKEMTDWRRDTKATVLKQHPTPTRGSFAANVVTYLKTLADRPTLQKDRTRDLAWVITKFGHRRRSSIARAEWHATFAELATVPTARGRVRAASTLKKARTAVFHLFTTLDGKDAPNPLRDIPPPQEPDAVPRAIPLEILLAILDAMPDRGRGVRHQKRSLVSQSKARLRVITFTGIPPTQLMEIRESHLNWAEPSVLLRGRRKGRGTKPVRYPLTPQAVDAFRAFFAARAEGRFSMSSVRQSFRRGIQTVVDTLAETDFRAAKRLYDQLRDARPTDLRHSWLTHAYLATHDIRATQLLAMHADARMTHRYTLAAIDPRLKDVVALLAGRLLADFGTPPAADSRRSSPHASEDASRTARENTPDLEEIPAEIRS